MPPFLLLFVQIGAVNGVHSSETSTHQHLNIANIVLLVDSENTTNELHDD